MNDAHLKPELPLKYNWQRGLCDIAAIVIAFVLMGALTGIVIGSAVGAAVLAYRLIAL